MLFPFDQFNAQPPKIHAIKLNSIAEKKLKQGHPWIFESSIAKIPTAVNSGDVAIIFSQKNNQVIGQALIDLSSPIRLKVLNANSSAKIDHSFFLNKVQQAFDLRKPMINSATNSFRLIFGENDNFPGLIVDVYNDTLVLKLYSQIWLPYMHILVPILSTISQCKTGVLRLNRLLSQEYPEFNGCLLFGNIQDEDVVFLEHGIQFKANVIHGHKTGYFLDHRHNRKEIGSVSKNKSVLDVFSYAGGFTIHALMGNAQEVTSVDISSQAMEMVKDNMELNGITGGHIPIIGDAFQILKNLIQQGKQYDIVVIDPPSLAKKQDEITLAIKKYKELAKMGKELVKKGGTLLLASCSSRVSSNDFFELCYSILNEGQRKFECFKTTLHDIDHPVTFEEGAYLKAIYFKALN